MSRLSIERVSLGGCGIGEEGADLVDVGQPADRVDVGAADELGVGARRRGRQVEPRQLLVDLLVDEVPRLAAIGDLTFGERACFHREP